MRIGLIAWMAALVVGTCGAQSAMWAPRKVYADAARGVRFEVPKSWKQGEHVSMATPDLMNDAEFRPTVVFASKGVGRLAKTNLEGVYFVYAVAPGKDEAACGAMVTKLSSGNGKSYTTPVGGRTFFVIDSGGGAAGHSFSGDIYVTFAAGSCYAFEVGEGLRSPGLVDSERDLSPKELAAIDVKLMALVKTVRIAR